MTTKPKCKTFIVLHNGQASHGGYTTLGRYKVGARNEKEAETLLRGVVGKHAKVNVYYEDKDIVVAHGSVVKDGI
jgi:hypothetical protein